MKKEDLIKNYADEFLKTTPFSPVFFKILKAMKDKKKSLFNFGNEISKDPVLTARILSVANSPLYGVKKKVSDLPFAVSLLGFDLVAVIILKSIKYKKTNTKKSPVYSNKNLWLHSLIVAHLCRIFARYNDTDISLEYYIAGLLHDIGKTAIIGNIKDSDLKKIELLVKSNLPLYEAESSVLGFNHTSVGTYILKEMNLSENIINAVKSHHKKIDVNFSDISFVLALSNILSKYLNYKDNEDLNSNLRNINLSIDDIPRIDEIYTELKIDLEHL